jgi:hypothetical protein
MARYDDDAPEATGWHDGERWALTGQDGEWTDEEQWEREAPAMAHVEPGDAREDQTERCPTCGRRGCVGHCDPADLWDDDYPEEADRWCRCAVCHENWVDAGNGFDTCESCLARR